MTERLALVAIFRMLIKKITHFQAYFDLFLITVVKNVSMHTQGLS